jgi:SAM-dependent methyltransferase
MHAGARHFVAYAARCITPRRRVLEIGSRDVNGSVRDLFPGAYYLGIDAAPGHGVDVVADGADFDPGETFDAVVSTEVLEHTPRGAEIVANACRSLSPGGVLILTAATDPRPAHSGIDGGPLRPGEYYGNVPPERLRAWLAGWHFVLIDTGNPGDVYALAVP